MRRSVSKFALAWWVLALSAAGCVKKSDYEALQGHRKQDHQTAVGHLKARDERIQTLSQALAEAEAKLKAQAEEIARLQAELASAQERFVAQQQQLTEMVKNSAGLKASIQEMQNALNVLREQKKQSEARVAEFKKLLNSFKAMIDAGKLKVKVVNGRMVVELPSDVLFASGSIDLSEAGKAAISEVGTIFTSMKDREFQVEGHTDNQPIRTARFPSNWELAAGRAIAVSVILIKAGLAPERVSAASFGEFRPVASNDKPETRAQNRRIEIVLVTDLSKVPGFDELEAAAKN
ncbi:MAG TPA: OmpA family protein [Polyangiales bacterium]